MVDAFLSPGKKGPHSISQQLRQEQCDLRNIADDEESNQ
jgi:hypothetical protein